MTSSAAVKRAVRRERIAQRFLDSVKELLDAGESYTEISVERLVERAGISRATFYVYFDDKGALLSALAADVSAELRDEALGWGGMPVDAARGDVRRLMDGFVALYRRHGALLAAVAEASRYDDTIRGEFHALISAGVEGLAQHIERDQELGYVRREIGAERTALWLTWMMERGLYQCARDADAAELERLTDALTTVLWNTLYRGAPAARTAT